MRIESIELENIRSYEEESVELDNGLILLYGKNGAGKSSLLSSIFSGLYMSDVLKFMGDDINLDSLVKRGEDEGTIRLEFGINGDVYEINWVISVREDDGERQASTSRCTLTGGDLTEPIEGVRDVKTAVEDIMGLGPESFVNSVYVQQGDITRMVNAGEEKRKEIIDGLLGLSKLDDYIDRMDKARLEFGSQRRTIDELLSDKQRQLDDLNDKTEIQEELESLKQKKSKIEDKKDKVEKGLSKYQKEIIELEQKIEQHQETEEKLEQVKKDIEDKKDRKDELEQKKKNKKSEIQSIETELKVLEDSIETKREELELIDETVAEIQDTHASVTDKLNTTRDSITKISEGEIQNVNNEISRNESEIEKLTQEISEHEDLIQDLESKIQDKKQTKENLESTIQDLKSNIQSIESKIRKKADQLEIEYENVNELRENIISEERERRIEKIMNVCQDLGGEQREKDIYQSVINNDSCPICGITHDETPQEVHGRLDELDESIQQKLEKIESMRNQEEVLDEIDELSDSLKEQKNELDVKETDLSRVIREIEEGKADLSAEKDDISRKNDQIEDLENQNSELRDELDELKSRLEDLRSDQNDLKDEKQSLESLISDIEDKDELQDEIEDRENKMENFDELRKNAQKQFLEKKREKKKLDDKLDDINISESRERKNKLGDKREEFKSKKEQFGSEISELQEEIASLKQELKRVREINSEVNRLESKKIEAKEEERNAESVIQSYNNVKSTLREENIGLLNKYANEIFNSVYDNKIYQRMRISEDYDITLVTGDGIEVDPKDLSGGEKTIVSLSIRAGVYKLLVERQGSADTLPPFILDEPTTYLDDSHVSNLQNVIETITSWDVPQVIIVSHREDMIQNADSGYEVEKDPATETSSVSKRY